jgi:UDP-N-acetylmuramoyl-L-alanyl-D-glutamate--2,6-diaminopimelate ligase
MRPLAELVSETAGARMASGDGGVPIRYVATDSRRVQPGDLFVAIPGQRVDGQRFVSDAIARGAAAVAIEQPPEQALAIPVVLVSDSRAAAADLAAAALGHPSRSMRLVGVTGTDGKTTVTRLIAQLARCDGRRVGWLTTVDVNVAGDVRRNRYGYTTPEAPEVQAVLAEMRTAGVEVAVLEASSHALAQQRLRSCEFEIGVFTNLAPEHLNFHGSLEEYRSAKALLFRTPQLRHAVLNADDPSWSVFRGATTAEVRTYALEAEADLKAEEVELSADGSRFLLRARRDPELDGLRLRTRFPGLFNVSNWLAAITAARALGVTTEPLLRTAEEAAAPPGRMQRLEAGQPFAVGVDFSHTPHALEHALRALRPHYPGRLLVAFGHAGERDPENRPAMGAAAARHADYFVITTDDPVHEDPAEISKRVAEGATGLGLRAGVDFAVILDRREAFRHLFERARAGDCVLLAGRGHEQSMPVAGEDVPFDDAEVARELLAALRP